MFVNSASQDATYAIQIYNASLVSKANIYLEEIVFPNALKEQIFSKWLTNQLNAKELSALR